MGNSELATKLRRIADDLESFAVSVEAGGTVNIDIDVAKRMAFPPCEEYYRRTKISIDLEYTESVAEWELRQSK